MAVYLNSKTAFTLYENETKNPYFIDKSQLLAELFPFVQAGNTHICITRPRRFGKTIAANMVAAFFSKGYCSRYIFDSLQIANVKDYEKHLNQYPVIHISFNDTSGSIDSYTQYLRRIEQKLIRDLRKEYPGLVPENEDSAIDALIDIYAEDDNARFIFVLDEWDYIFHQEHVTEEDKKKHLSYLRSLLKDRPYVRMTYMTGILPIAKYSSGSELNMFIEYTMAAEARFSEYFGFTDREVDELMNRYMQTDIFPKLITKEGLKYWYDGYHIRSGERIYNPRSVVVSLTNNHFGNYWTSSGPYDELFYYVKHNVAEVRDDLARLVSGQTITMHAQEYAAVSMNLNSKQEIFSAMLVYGFLSYENGRIFIPNKELMNKFAEMLKKESTLGYVYRLAKESERMLQATLNKDTETMSEILERAHDTEVPLLSYNHETELTALVNLVYLSARDQYRIEREDKAGKGFVDFIFYPEQDKNADCIILELKVDHPPETALQQIKNKQYALRFRGKRGEAIRYSGRILAVGISYDKKLKKHRCMIEDIT